MNLIKLQIEELGEQSITDYCRQLVKDQFHPDTRVEVYKGEMLCLIVTNIEEAAKLKVKENAKEGPKFVEYKPMSEKDKARLSLKSI